MNSSHGEGIGAFLFENANLFEMGAGSFNEGAAFVQIERYMEERADLCYTRRQHERRRFTLGSRSIAGLNRVGTQKYSSGGDWMTYTIRYTSPLGDILLAEREGALIGLWIAGQDYASDLCGETVEERETPLLRETKEWLARYFAGERPAIEELPLAPRGSVFRQAVWRLLCCIPYGTTTTYGALAREVAALTGKSCMSAQAVGGAVGHNPISIIIPCHRVVGTNGSLTGYGGGLSMKIALLEHEGIDMSAFFVPKHGTKL